MKTALFTQFMAQMMIDPRQRVLFEMTGSTSVSVDKTDNDNHAKISCGRTKCSQWLSRQKNLIYKQQKAYRSK